MFRRLVLSGLVLTGLLAISFSALAVVQHQRTELIPVGAEWIVGRDGLSQASFEAPAPRAFIGRYGGKWIHRHGGDYSKFSRIFGQGVAVDPAVMHDSLVAETVALDFWRDNEDLLPSGVSHHDLKLRANTVWNGIRIVGHTQTVDGVPVEGAGVFLVFKAGRMIMLEVRAFPSGQADTTATVGKKQSADSALVYLKSRGFHAEVRQVRLVLLPLIGNDTLSLKSVYSIELLGDSGRWTAFVDAKTAEIFAMRDERMFMSATVEMKHHVRNIDPDESMVDTAASFLNVSVNDSDDVLDSLGVFTVDGDTANVSGDLVGEYVKLVNQGDHDFVFDFTDVADAETVLLEWDGAAETEEEHMAQLDLYHFTQAVRDFSLGYQDDVSWLNDQFTVKSNQPNFDENPSGDKEYCNAWSDGESINFLMEGEVGTNGYHCANTAMLADVVYHEYGHAIHLQNAMLGSGVFDSAVSEGLADSTSSAMSWDHVLGNYFYYHPDTGEVYNLRDLEPDKVWPDDQEQDEHATGLILGGSVWDIRKALVAEFGESTGHTMTDDLLYTLMRLMTDIPSVFESTLIWDDDNGDISDGTPNLCLIYDAYTPHGVASQDGFGRIALDHQQLVEVDPNVIIPVDLIATVTFEECSELGEVRVTYSTDEGETWTDVVATSQGGDSFRAELPAMEAGSEFFYRIEVDEVTSGEVVMKPSNKAEPYYKAYVGPLAEIYCDDLETENDEWVHELVSGEDIEGADDWQWGTPSPNGGDPDGAFSGDYVWGNDLTPEENWNGQYQPDRINMLTSPAYDFSDYDTVRLRFRRWLTVEDGYFDNSVVSISTDDMASTEVWRNFMSEGGDEDPHLIHHIDKEWISFDLDISQWAAGQTGVHIHWLIMSDGGLQFGGWNIDDVCFYTSDEEYLPEPDSGVEDPDGGVDAGDAGEPKIGVKSGACSCENAGSGDESFSLLGLLF